MTAFPTTVKTFVAKVDNVDDVRASHVNDLQDEVNALENQLYKHYARANRATAQTALASGSATILDFATVVFDPDSKITTGGAWKYTAPRTGKYWVQAMINFAATTAFAVGEQINFAVYKNGSNYCVLDSQFNHDATSHAINLSGGTLVDLAATDYIDIRVFHNCGSALDTVASLATQCWVTVHLVMP